MTVPMVVTIDGPAASGKSTLAQRLAQALGLPFLDTGLLYRAVGRRLLEAGGDPRDAMPGYEPLGLRIEPTGVPGLEGDGPVEPLPYGGEEVLRDVGLECQARRELDEQRAQLVAELGRFPDEAVEHVVDAHQATLMGRHLRHLD